MEPQGQKKLAWVQNDLFCECGYNLFAQPVQVDERLGLPVSRCPECGKFHAMTTTFASLSTWRTRQEQAMILSLTLVVLFIMALFSLGIWGMQMGYLGLDFEIRHYYDRHLYYNLPQGYDPSMFQRTPDSGDAFVLNWGMHLYRLACMLAGFIYVSTAMTFFWHWKKRFYFLLMIVPALSALLAIWGIYMDGVNRWSEFRDGRGEMRIILGALFEIIGMAMGVYVGRRTVRGLIRTFVPPKWRTPFKHLWLVDGLQMPKIEFTNPTESAASGRPEMRAEGPPESKVPEARKGLDSATDVISRMMSGEKKSGEEPPG